MNVLFKQSCKSCLWYGPVICWSYLCTLVMKVYHGVRKVYHGVRKVYHGVRKVYHDVRMVYHGVRKVYHGIIKVYYAGLQKKYLSEPRTLPTSNCPTERVH